MLSYYMCASCRLHAHETSCVNSLCARCARVPENSPLLYMRACLALARQGFVHPSSLRQACFEMATVQSLIQIVCFSDTCRAVPKQTPGCTSGNWIQALTRQASPRKKKPVTTWRPCWLPSQSLPITYQTRYQSSSCATHLITSCQHYSRQPFVSRRSRADRTGGICG